MRYSIVISINIIAIILNASSAMSQQPTESPQQVRIPVHSNDSLKKYTGLFHREDVRNDSVTLHLSNDQLDQFETIYPGLKYLPGEAALDDSDMASSLAEARSHDKYPTYEQYDSMMHYFANTYPDICMIDTIGTSIQGRLLLALKISDYVEHREDEPSFFYTATIHGDELVGYNLSLRFIDFLLQNYPSDPEVERLLNEVELWINPLSNPDATYYPNDNSSVASSIRTNVNGYDLNRNYPDPRSGEPNDTSGVQHENQQMMLFMNKHRFHLSANLHSGAEVVNYPWDHTFNLHPDNDWFVLISREYADAARVYNEAYMDEFANGITNGADWYVIYGGRQDYVTYYLHGRELTLELSNRKKIQSENLLTYWTYNQRSLLNLANQARYGIHGKVTSSVSGTPIEAEIRVLTHDDSASWVKSDPHYGSFYRYLKEGTYNLELRAEEYITDTIYNVAVRDFEKTVIQIQLDSVGTVIDTVGIQRKFANHFRIYPNPASGRFYIEKTDPGNSETHYRIVTLSGQSLQEGVLDFSEGRAQIDPGPAKPGIYLIHLRSREKQQTERIIIR